jgi:hypothetical protein
MVIRSDKHKGFVFIKEIMRIKGTNAYRRIFACSGHYADNCDSG